MILNDHTEECNIGTDTLNLSHLISMVPGRSNILQLNATFASTNQRNRINVFLAFRVEKWRTMLPVRRCRR